ncbi:MAG: hypothetical protein JWM82_1570 [Myxococcales bacterium]|nr:hypothetical protein [Myxococcales bacterium]
MNAQGLSRDSLEPSPSTVFLRLALVATALSLSFGLAGSCTPATDGPGDAGGAGMGVAGIAMTGGSTGAAGVTGMAGSGGTCQSPPTVHLLWAVAIYQTTTVLTCQQAGATAVEVVISSNAAAGNPAPVVVQFPCTDGAGSTTKIAAGSWIAQFILTKDNGGTVLSQGTVPNLTVPSCGTLDLGKVTFNVSAPSSGTAGSGGRGGSGGSAGSTGAAGAGGNTGAAGGTGPCDAKPILAMHSCTVPMACHDAMGVGAGFDMVTAGWETRLVGKLPNKSVGPVVGLRSQCDPVGGAYLVKGSVPAKGLFLDKLRNTNQACGMQMPLISSYLSAGEMDCVQRWANALTKP